MNAFGEAFVSAAAATLGHLLWQATAIAAALAITLRVMRGRSSSLRYAAAVAALALIVAAAAVTFGGSWSFEPLSATEETLPLSGKVGSFSLPAAAANGEAAEGLRQRTAPVVAPFVVFAWLAGVFAFSLRLVVGYGRVIELVRDAERELESEWSRALERLRGRIPEAAGVRLLHSLRVQVPTVAGVLRPVILVPIGALTGLTPRQVETILAHELAHIRRHDYFVNLLQSVIETLFFFHPAVWWVSGQIRAEREHCCDDLAIEACGDRLLYARALAELEVLRSAGTPAMAASGGSLVARIRRIAGTDGGGHTRPGAIVAIAALTLAAAVSLAAPLSTADEAPISIAPAAWKVNGPVAALAASLAAVTMDESAVVVPIGAPESLSVENPDVVATAKSQSHGASAGTDFTWAWEVHTANGHAAEVHALSVASNADAVGHAYRFDSKECSEPVRVAMNVPGEVVNVVASASGKAPSVEQVIRLRKSAVHPEFARGMEKAGYDLSPGELAALRASGVSVDWVRSLGEAGYDGLEVHEMQALRAVGVSADYVRRLASLGITDLDPEELVTLRAVGVSAEYIGAMRRIFTEKLDVDDLTQMKAVGVTSEYAAAITAAGIDADAERMIELRAVGVTPEYLQGLRAAGYHDARLEDIISARAVGVTPEWLGSMRRIGIEGLDLDDLVSMRAVGVTPEWVDQMKAEGFRDMDADEMQQLKALGVTPGYVRSLRNAGLSELSVEDLIELRANGIDADFVRSVSGSREPRKPRR